MSAVQAITARARLRPARVRLVAVDRRGATLLSIGALASGLLAYAFNVLAARSLGAEAYGAVAALWASMFLLAVLLFRPLEQTLSRAVADHVARDADARPAVRATARLTAVVLGTVTLALAAAWVPLTDGLFGGRAVLTAALIAGVAGYAVSYFVRGLLGGVGWFGGYGLLLLADGGIRIALALPLLLVASPAVAGAAIAAAAIGGGLVPLMAPRRRELGRMAGAGASDFAVGAAMRFAMPAAVIAGCEQVLLSGGPLLVLIAGGDDAAAAAGVLFAAMMLVRAPVFLFQAVAAHLLPSLTTFRARGDERALHRATVRTAAGLATVACAMALGALAAGPEAMAVLYGDGFEVTRLDLALLALGVGAFLAAGTFSQAVLARAQAGRAALDWAVAAVGFVGLHAVLAGDAFHRVCLAFAVASAAAAVLLLATIWRARG